MTLTAGIPTRKTSLTDQTFYEGVREYFSRPDARKSGGDNDGCRYRKIVGDKIFCCAIGCQIPDTFYIPEFDSVIGSWVGFTDVVNGDRVMDSHVENAVRKVVDYFSNVDNDLLSMVQTTHDSYPNTSDFAPKFIERLDNIARRFGLTVPKEK